MSTLHLRLVRAADGSTYGTLPITGVAPQLVEVAGPDRLHPHEGARVFELVHHIVGDSTEPYYRERASASEARSRPIANHDREHLLPAGAQRAAVMALGLVYPPPWALLPVSGRYHVVTRDGKRVAITASQSDALALIAMAASTMK